jgi:hypothetical protein
MNHLDEINRRLASLDEKMDRVLERSAENAVSIRWLKTIGGFVATACLTACGWLINYVGRN